MRIEQRMKANVEIFALNAPNEISRFGSVGTRQPNLSNFQERRNTADIVTKRMHWAFIGPLSLLLLQYQLYFSLHEIQLIL